uniref:Putative ATPase domain containing protein n=1 Tax=viral metagenome TaxID=1070528 RepID=A0A6M3JNZ8_9ZZZZ
MTIDNENQLMSWKAPYRSDAIIEDGILLPGTVMMLFGAAGTWKTMNVFHLAYSISMGKDWFGFDTSPATVFCHQVELPKALYRDRFLKYRTGNKLTSGNIFFTTPDDDVLLDTTFGISELIKNIEEVKRRASDPKLPLVIILDPLYLYLSGHISDEYDVRKFQRNVNSIRRKYNATFIIIHHSRLTRVDAGGDTVDLGAEEIMGSSYWNNWLDTILRIKVVNPFSGSDIVYMTFNKTRNAQSFLAGFKVKWNRSNLVPEIIDRDIIEGDDPTIRGLTD